MTCESCGHSTTALFHCSCRMLVCQQCRQGEHEAHYRAWREANADATRGG